MADKGILDLYEKYAKKEPPKLTPADILRQMVESSRHYNPVDKYFFVETHGRGNALRFRYEEKSWRFTTIEPVLKFEFMSRTADLMVIWLLRDCIDTAEAWCIALEIAQHIGWEMEPEEMTGK